MRKILEINDRGKSTKTNPWNATALIAVFYFNSLQTLFSFPCNIVIKGLILLVLKSTEVHGMPLGEGARAAKSGGGGKRGQFSLGPQTKHYRQ